MCGVSAVSSLKRIWIVLLSGLNKSREREAKAFLPRLVKCLSSFVCVVIVCADETLFGSVLQNWAGMRCPYKLLRMILALVCSKLPRFLKKALRFPTVSVYVKFIAQSLKREYV